MALIECGECSRQISDRAGACPHCGAPNAKPAATASVEATPTQTGGEVCPFSGYAIPPGATVCICGAYYGCKGGVLDDRKFGLLLKLLGTSIVALASGFGLARLADSMFDSESKTHYLLAWPIGALFLVGGLGTLVFGAVFLFSALPLKLRGKHWWRSYG